MAFWRIEVFLTRHREENREFYPVNRVFLPHGRIGPSLGTITGPTRVQIAD